MTTDLWERARRLFGKPMPSRKVAEAIAGWRADARSTGKRELLHPMKGWVTEAAARGANDVNPQWNVRQAAHLPVRAK